MIHRTHRYWIFIVLAVALIGLMGAQTAVETAPSQTNNTAGQESRQLGDLTLTYDRYTFE